MSEGARETETAREFRPQHADALDPETDGGTERWVPWSALKAEHLEAAERYIGDPEHRERFAAFARRYRPMMENYGPTLGEMESASTVLRRYRLRCRFECVGEMCSRDEVAAYVAGGLAMATGGIVTSGGVDIRTAGAGAHGANISSEKAASSSSRSS